LINTLFKCDEFKETHSDQKARRDLIGNAIYEYVEKLIGVEFAPKITGMIIDLPDIDLIPTVSTLENLTAKVMDGHALLEHLKLHGTLVLNADGVVVVQESLVTSN